MEINETSGLLKKVRDCDSVYDYLMRAEAGTIIAFKTGKRVLSGALMETYNGLNLLIQTKNGTIFDDVLESDVLWVKTGARWPKWVYDQFEHEGKGKGKGKKHHIGSHTVSWSDYEWLQ